MCWVAVDHEADEVRPGHSHPGRVSQVEHPPVFVPDEGLGLAGALDLEQDVDLVLQVLEELALDVQGGLARTGQVNQRQVRDIRHGEPAVDPDVADSVIRAYPAAVVLRIRDERPEVCEPVNLVSALLLEQVPAVAVEGVLGRPQAFQELLLIDARVVATAAGRVELAL